MAGYDGMNGEFAMRLQGLIGAAQGAGFHIGINSGYRSPERQAQLWEQALAKYGDPEVADNWVARPGKSHHGKGIAADLDFGDDPGARRWIHAHAAQFGLFFPMDWEPWHIEPTGANSLADRGAYTTPPPGYVNPVDNQPDPHDIGTQFQTFLGAMAGGVSGTELMQSPEAGSAPTASESISTEPEDIMGTMAQGGV